AAKEEAHAMRIKANQKSIRLIEEYETQNLKVTMDPVFLQIMLQNLLANAIQYTPEGGTITLSIRKESTRILLIVRDTGHGIPIREQGQVFSKHYRASNASKHVPQGTGLGLYIVKSILTA